MLPNQFRLPASVSFKNASVHTNQYFLVKVVSSNLQNSRFGFIIGKAIAKQATERNRAKRLLRSCIEEQVEQIIGGYDMLFLLKKGIIGAEREILLHEVHAFLKNNNLIRR